MQNKTWRHFSTSSVYLRWTLLSDLLFLFLILQMTSTQISSRSFHTRKASWVTPSLAHWEPVTYPGTSSTVTLKTQGSRWDSVTMIQEEGAIMSHARFISFVSCFCFCRKLLSRYCGPISLKRRVLPPRRAMQSDSLQPLLVSNSK